MSMALEFNWFSKELIILMEVLKFLLVEVQFSGAHMHGINESQIWGEITSN